MPGKRLERPVCRLDGVKLSPSAELLLDREGARGVQFGMLASLAQSATSGRSRCSRASGGGGAYAIAEALSNGLVGVYAPGPSGPFSVIDPPLFVPAAEIIGRDLAERQR
jgi:hypothetical protein